MHSLTTFNLDRAKRDTAAFVSWQTKPVTTGEVGLDVTEDA